MLKLRLKELYEERGVTQKEVSEVTGIRAGTLSGLANNMRTSWDVCLLERLLVYFELKDITELIQYEPPQDVEKYLEQYNKSKEDN